MSIIAEIPYSYAAHVIPQACRNPRWVGMRSQVIMRFEELDSRDLGHVATLDMRPYVDMGSSIDYYRAPGGHIVKTWRAAPTLANQDRLPLRAASFEADLAWMGEYRGPHDLFLDRLKQPVEDWMDEHEPLRRRLDDSKASRRADLRAVLDGAAFVDGMLCTRSSGPAWKLEAQGPDIIVTARPEFSARPDYFGSNKRHVALAVAHAINQTRSTDGVFASECRGKVEFQGSIDVLMPGMLEVDDDWMSLGRQVAMVMAQPVTYRYSTQISALWTSLVEMVGQGWPADRNQPLLSLVSHLAPVMDQVAIRSYNPFGGVVHALRRLDIGDGLAGQECTPAALPA